MHILDTDTLTHLHAGNHRVVERLRTLADPEVRTTIITKIELLRGRFDFVLKAEDRNALLRAQQWLQRTEALLAQIPILLLDEQAINEFERLQANRRVRKIGRADVLIASIALSRRATLVTRNLRHFRQIPNLKVTNWVD